MKTKQKVAMFAPEWLHVKHARQVLFRELRPNLSTRKTRTTGRIEQPKFLSHVKYRARVPIGRPTAMSKFDLVVTKEFYM